ncbi:MAG: pro-sigmaK processing inhibitor BofA family protein [Clostridia bacterium]|nr:pro-sigmaK processing inhibitor BofA family protein [Clostridia bacterium]
MSSLFKFCLIASLAIGCLIIIVAAFRTKRFFSCLILSALQGIAAHFAVNALGMVTGLHLSLNGYTIASSIIGGTPAVIGMIITEIILS